MIKISNVCGYGRCKRCSEQGKKIKYKLSRLYNIPGYDGCYCLNCCCFLLGSSKFEIEDSSVIVEE